jgi:selenocysteine lyase/cysteine desulfurase
MDKFMVPAGPDHAQIAACNGIIDYFDLVDEHHYPKAKNGSNILNKRERISDLFRNSEINNLKPLLDYIADRSDLRLLGPNNNILRAPTIAFTSKSKSPEKIVKALAKNGIMAGAGDFYAVRPLKALGIDPNLGVVRLSFVHYTSKVEINAAIEALDLVL